MTNNSLLHIVFYNRCTHFTIPPHTHACIADPAVFIGTTVIKVLEGDSVSIEAGIYSSSPSEVQWFLGMQFLDIGSDPQLSQTIEGNVYTLNIASINSQRVGLYSVVVNRNGQTAFDNVTVSYSCECMLCNNVPWSYTCMQFSALNLLELAHAVQIRIGTV